MACSHGDLGYSAIVNLLDFTAVAFPAGFVDKDQDPPPSSFVPLSKDDEIACNSCKPLSLWFLYLALRDSTRR